MRRHPPPASWTAGRSAAALMSFTGYLGGAALSERQLGLARFELEKYALACHEPAPEVVIADALQFSATQVTGDDWHDPSAFGRAHGGEILRRRNRELLHAALSACARIAALGSGLTPKLEAWLHDIAIHAPGHCSVDDGPVRWQLGDDDIRELKETKRLPPLPDLAETSWRLRSCVALLSRPPGWSVGHALAFVLLAAHVVDRPSVPPPTPLMTRILADPAFGPATPRELLLAAWELLERCCGRRFVILRALEDQLMTFASGSMASRAFILELVNTLAVEELTVTRRAIVTATMAVLATSPKAMQRERRCPAWPG